MAGNNNLAVQILINAKDQASSVIDGVLNKWTALTAALGAFVGIDFLTDAISDAAEFEAALDKVQARTGSTTVEMEALRDAAMEAGSTTSFTATEAAQALEILGAAGLNASDSIATLPSVLALAKGESIELADAAGLITDAVSIMGLSFEESSRATDVLVKAANLSNTTATDLGYALKYAGGEARAAGMDIEDLAGVLDVLATNGIRGEQAGTMLRNILGQLGDPASKARIELADLGVTTGDLGTAIDAIAAAGPAGEAAIRAFGVEAGPVVRALLTEGSAGIAEYVTQLRAAEGAAQDSADVMSGNLNGAIQGMQSAWDALRIQLVEPLLEPIANEVRALADELQKFTQTAQFEQLKQTLLDGFEAMTAQIHAFVDAVDWNAFAETLSAALTNASASLTAWQEDVDGVVTGVGLAFDSLQTGFAVIEAAFYGLAGAGATAFETILNGLAASVDGVAKFSFGPLKTALKATSAELTEIAESFGASAEVNFSRASGAMDDVVAHSEDLRAKWTALNDESQKTAQGIEDVGQAQQDAVAPSEALLAAQSELESALALYNSALAESMAGNADAGNSLVALGAEVAAAQATVDALTGAVQDEGAAHADTRAEIEASSEALVSAAGQEQAALASTEERVAALIATREAHKAALDEIESALNRAAIASGQLAAAQAEADAAQREYDSALEAGSEHLDLYEQALAAARARLAELETTIEAGTAAEERKKDVTAALTKAIKDLEGATAALVTERERELAAAERNTDAIESESDARVTHLRNLADEAEARGDTAEAARLNEQAAKAEIAAIQSLIKAKQSELIAEQSLLQSKIAAAELDGTISEQEQQDLENTQQSIAAKQAEIKALQEQVRHLQALKDANEDTSETTEDASEKTEDLGDSMQQTGGLAEWMAKVINGAIDDLRQYSEAAADAVQAIMDSVDSWNNKIAEIRQLDTGSLFDTSATAEASRELAALGAAAEAAEQDIIALDKAQRGAFNMLAPFWDGIQAIKEVELAAIEAERRMVSMEIASQKLGDALSDLQRQLDDGSISTSDFIRQAEQLEFQFQQLDDEDLDGLRDAIADARREMDDFTRSAQDGLVALQMEWARLNDNEAEALKLQYQQDILEIEAQIAEARANNNAEALRALEKQLRVRTDIYNKELDNLEVEQQQTAERERQAELERTASQGGTSSSSSSGTSTEPAPSQSSAATPVRTVNVNISVPSGQSGTVQVLEGYEDTLESLLRSLEAGQSVT